MPHQPNRLLVWAMSRLDNLEARLEFNPMCTLQSSIMGPLVTTLPSSIAPHMTRRGKLSKAPTALHRGITPASTAPNSLAPTIHISAGMMTAATTTTTLNAETESATRSPNTAAIITCSQEKIHMNIIIKNQTLLNIMRSCPKVILICTPQILTKPIHTMIVTMSTRTQKTIPTTENQTTPLFRRRSRPGSPSNIIETPRIPPSPPRRTGRRSALRRRGKIVAK